MMESQITAFDQKIVKDWDGKPYPTNFSGHLYNANSNRGTAIIDPERYPALLLELDGLKALGVKAISINIDYPIIHPAFDPYGGQSADFLAFYQKVVADIRARGLKVIVETAAIFSQADLSDVHVMPFYRRQTLSEYSQGRAEQAARIARILRPDYLSVIQEPDTEGSQTGKSELSTPEGSYQLLTQILSAYKSTGVTGVMIGAGTGTWMSDYTAFINKFATTSIDFIDTHVYPVNNDNLTRAATIARLAASAGKKIAISEAWLFKVRDTERTTVPKADIFARDTFSFWAPLDQEFLLMLQHLCYLKKVEFIGFFGSIYFRGYIEYNESTAGLSAAELQALASGVQSEAMQTGEFTSTGLAFHSYILPGDAAPPAPPELSLIGVLPGQLSIEWAPSPDNVGTAGYRIVRDGKEVGVTASTIFADTTVADGKTYTYSASAFDAAGNSSSLSAPLPVTTPDLTPPTAPTRLRATVVLDTQIDLAWRASTDNVGVAAYRVFWGLDTSSLAQIASTPDPAYSVTNVKPGTTNCFAVSAADARGIVSEQTAPVCAATPDTIPPRPPESLTLNFVSTNKIAFIWKAALDNAGVNGYEIHRSEDGGEMAPIAVTRALGYIDATVRPRVRYGYRVLAYDAAGNSSNYSPALVVVSEGLPDTTPPDVVIIAPQSGATVSGVTGAAAAAGDPFAEGQATSGVASVRFQIDGVDAGAEVVTAPYAGPLDTTRLRNGVHSLTAIATDAAGNTRISPAISFTVNN